MISALARRPTQAASAAVGRSIARALEVSAWAVLVLVVALAVALPEEPTWVILGALGSVAGVLVLVRPLLGIPLLASKVDVSTAFGWWYACTRELIHRITQLL